MGHLGGHASVRHTGSPEFTSCLQATRPFSSAVLPAGFILGKLTSPGGKDSLLQPQLFAIFYPSNLRNKSGLRDMGGSKNVIRSFHRSVPTLTNLSSVSLCGSVCYQSASPRRREKGHASSQIAPILHNPSSATLEGKERLLFPCSNKIPGEAPDCFDSSTRPSAHYFGLGARIP